MSKRRTSITLTDPYIECLDCLIEEDKVYNSYPDAIRAALRMLFSAHGFGNFASPNKRTRM